MDDFGNTLFEGFISGTACDAWFEFEIDSLRWDGYCVDQFFPE